MDRQIGLLTLKKERLEKLISLAREIRQGGASRMDFSAFDKTKLEEYARRAKAEWGGTPEYREYERKAEGRSEEGQAELNRRMMAVFAEIGALRGGDPASAKVQELVKKLRDFISEHYYACSDKVLAGLGLMYAAGGPFYATPGKGRNEVRMAYVLEREKLERAMEVLAAAIERYNAR